MNENDGVDFESGGMVDLSSVEDVKFEVLPKGMYTCEVDSLEYSISQRSGNPMWSWTLRVSEGEHAGRKIFFHTVWKGEGLPRTKKTLSRVAPELLQGPFNPADQNVIDTVIGRTVQARVDQRKYEGEMRNNVRDLFGATGS